MPQPPNPQTPAETFDLTGQTVGRFVIRARLGAGGMGEVYRADDTTLKRPVALKRMSAKMRTDTANRRRFLREAQLASGLSNPHIAGVYDVLETDGEMFVVMELVSGVTLRQRLAQPLRLEEFLSLAVQCADALVAAHRQNIIHRDIKPENIMLGEGGRVKILDFGVAKLLPRAEDAETLTLLTTEPGSLSGTLPYMAPEVLLEKEPDQRTDIFSLGVVFYEALAGRHPFLGGSFAAVAGRILHETPPPLRERNSKIPAELERIVAKMLAKEPAERYATAADLLVDLRALERGAAPLAPAPWRQPRWALVAAAVLVVAGVLASIPAVRRPVSRWFGARPAITGAKSLAVLPFRAVGQSAESQAFAEGITETLTAKLTQLTATHQFQVIPASEVRARKVTDAEKARKELGVSLAFEGSLDRSGSMARVNYALVDTASLRQLRADTITAEASNPFSLQDQVAANVVEMLALELKPNELQRLQARDTQVAAAFDLYLKGRGYLRNYDRAENVDNAIRAFLGAVALDHKFAAAQAGLGEAYWKRYELSKAGQWVIAARNWCASAMALDPKLAEAHLCAGTLDNGTGEYASAVVHFQGALEAEPTNDDGYRGLGFAFEKLQAYDKAEQTYRKAIALRPDYWAGYNWLGVFYFSHGRVPDAVEAFRKVVALAPGSYRGHSNLGAALFKLGRIAEAIEPFERSVGIQPTGTGYSNLATVYFYQRRYADAVRTFGEAIKLDAQQYAIWRNLGDAYFWAPGQRADSTGAYQKAETLAAEKLKVNPRDAGALSIRAICQAMLGEKKKARDDLAASLKLAPDDPDIRFDAALVQMQLGDAGQAVAWLGKALEAGYSVSLVRDTPNFDSLHSDPRFQQLLQGK